MNIEEMLLYPTELVNKSVEQWPIYEKTRVLYIVPPGHTEIIESWKPTTDIARWLRIVKEKDGRITLTENPQWSNPWMGQHYCIELENIDGSSEESIPCVVPNPGVTTAAAFLHAPQGWPVIYPLHLYDPLIRFGKIIWKKKTTRQKIVGTPYFSLKEEVVKEMVPRPRAELKKILAERAAIEAEKLKAESNKMLKKQEALLGMGEGEDA